MALQIKDLPIGNYMTAFPISVLPDVSLSDAVSFMARRGIGSLIVSKEDGFPLGIFTERDILFKVLYAKVPFKESVELFSSFPLITSKTGILANEAASVMAANNIKRLALTKDGEIVGVVTALDLVRAFQQASSHS